MNADELARAVDAAAASVEGVARVYASRRAPVGVVSAVVTGDDPALSSVQLSDPVAVTVSIGVLRPARSADVAERVSRAVLDVVGDGAAVRVRVSRVHPA